MELRREFVSSTVTRYLVSAVLGPHAQLLLVRPDDDVVVASWAAGSDECLVNGEWVSPFADLVAAVRGEDRSPTAERPVLRLVDGGSPRAESKSARTAAS